MKRYYLNKKIIFSAAIFLSITGFATTEEIPFDRINMPEGLSIKEVQELQKEGVLLSKKVVIEQKATQSNQESSTWEITAKNLPVTQEMCQKKHALRCDELSLEAKGFPKGICSNICLMYGPGAVDYDSERKQLYLSVNAATNEGGGATSLWFIADIKTKKIEPFNEFFEELPPPPKETTSPSGNTLLLVDPNTITIIDTKTRKRTSVDMSASRKEGEEYRVSISQWPNDVTASYSLLVTDKHTNEKIKSIEEEFNIKKQRVVSRTIHTYNRPLT